eukprot:TRINITY_DN28512_c0_g1_i1.p1 TRINITY_DN28512_c0_g1~~TRINITY_DN28512_c0_g1_i1.p1  ORF type:complete len:375 (-),score=65.99 TRINITY_DN28512_c0_g1_i1:797-1921(-)
MPTLRPPGAGDEPDPGLMAVPDIVPRPEPLPSGAANYLTPHLGEHESVWIPPQHELAGMAKEELLALLEQIRVHGSHPQVFAPPKLVRSLTAELENMWETVKGNWEDDDRGIFVLGTPVHPAVRFVWSRFRNVRELSVRDVHFEVPDEQSDGVLSFTVAFAPDQSNEKGEAHWKLYGPSGRLELEINGESTTDFMRRPEPKPDVFSRMIGLGKKKPMARMTEPASKALGNFESFLPYKLCDDDGKPWSLPVLRTEAVLRLSDDYLHKAGEYFDLGLVPPTSLDQELEIAALEEHGFKPGQQWVEAYRFASCMLSEAEREEIFFLRADDRLFRPDAQVVSKQFQGGLFASNEQFTKSDELFPEGQRTLVIASTTS